MGIHKAFSHFNIGERAGGPLNMDDAALDLGLDGRFSPQRCLKVNQLPPGAVPLLLWTVCFHSFPGSTPQKKFWTAKTKEESEEFPFIRSPVEIILSFIRSLGTGMPS